MGYIIAGDTLSFGTGLYDIYLIKTDPSGNVVWTKTFGGTYNDYGRSVRQTSDGGYIITGDREIIALDPDAYLRLKTDASGNATWEKRYGDGTTNDYGTSVQQTSDGGYIITGFTPYNGAGGFDVYLIKTDANGDVQ
jgi:hypothetical protein